MILKLTKVIFLQNIFSLFLSENNDKALKQPKYSLRDLFVLFKSLSPTRTNSVVIFKSFAYEEI